MSSSKRNKRRPTEQSAAKAQESEQKYRRLYDAAQDMIFLRDPGSGRMMDVNPAACHLLGYPQEELLWRSYFNLLATEEEVSEARRQFTDAMRSGTGTHVAVFRRKDGSLFEAEVRNTPIEIANRIWMLGIARDLTAQRQLERQAMAFYQAFLNSNDYMLYTDRNGIILDVNDAFIHRFGFTREQAVGRTPRLVRSKHTPQELYQHMWRDILDPGKGFWRGRLVNQTKSGREVPVLISITSVKDPKGGIIGFVSSAVNLAEQEKLQRRLAKSESLAAVGTMAAVLAHEIRNPLGSIVTAASSISHADLLPEDRDTLLRVIRKETQRLSDSLSQFLQYARPREPRKTDTDLNGTVREVLKIVRSDSKLKGKVRVEERLGDRVSPSPFDGNQIRQILWNVIINAFEAMKGRGRLRVSTEDCEGQTIVRIDDTGPGIQAADLAKIFQPFHSTKQRGTGLGLAVAEQVATAHGGRLLVESEPSRGTCFSLVLPGRQEET